MSFAIREAVPADFPRIVEILNQQITEPTDLADYIRQDNARPKGDPYRRVVAQLPSGEIAAFGVTIHEAGNRPGEFFARARVDAPYRNQGIGSAIYRHLEEFAIANGANRIESGVREQDTADHAWAERRGFVRENHLFESTRTLTDWDPAPFQEAVEQVRAAGFRFATVAQVTESMDRLDAYRKLHGLLAPLVHDIPSNEDRPLMPFDEWYNYVKDDPEARHDRILLVLDGDTWAGMAAIRRMASGALYHDFTGIAREYRGRGLTLALKVEALNLAKKLEAPYIRTNNLSINPRILAVNKRLGYVPAPGIYFLAKKLA